MKRIAVVCAIAFGVATAAAAFGPASDFADATAYADGWIDGDEGGTGWPADLPWTFLPTVAPFAIESSTANGDGDSNGDGDIDTAGKSFKLVALNDALGYAIRFLDPVPLLIGDRVAFDFDAVGSGSLYFASCSLMENIGTPQQRWAFHVAGDAAHYAMIDSAGTTSLGIPITDEGVHVEFDLTGTDSYTARVTPRGGATTVRSGTLASGGDITSFLCAIGGGGEGISAAYFNSVVIPEPDALAAALGAVAALAAIAKRS